MKKLILPLLLILLVFIIYKYNDNNLIDYLSLGDSLSLGINSYGNKTYGYNDYLQTYLDNNNLLHKYNNCFSKANYKINDLIVDIQNNKTVFCNDKNYNLKKELREADLLTISIGMDEIVEIVYNNKDISKIKIEIDELINKMDSLLKEITSLSKIKIILIGYYNPNTNYNLETDRLFSYISDKYKNISKKYKIDYVDIYNIIKNNQTYIPNKLDYHLTSKGYLEIAKAIINKSNL